MDNRFFDDRRNKSESHLSDTGNQVKNVDSACAHEVNSQNRVQQQDGGPVFRPQDMEYLANYVGQVVEQTISKRAQIPQSGSGSKDFENNVIWYLEQLYNGIIATDRNTNQKYYTNFRILRNQDSSTEKLDSIVQELQELRQLVEGQAKVIEEQAAIIKKQHENIIRYENDVIYKTQKDLIMELIGIADQLRYTLNDYAQEKDFDSLYKSIGDLTEWVDGSLQAVAVRKCVNAESKELDRKRQEIVEIQETDNLEEDGKIKSMLPGYIWSVPMVGSNEMHDESERPKSYEFMIRPEQVVRLRYIKPIEQHSEQKQPGQTEKVSLTDDNCDKKPSVEDKSIQNLNIPESSDDQDKKTDEKKLPFWGWK